MASVFFGSFLGSFAASAAYHLWKWWRSEYDIKKKS